MGGIIITALGKVYGKNKVLDDINLNITEPGVYLVAGPNGSGKTTLLELITGLRKKTEGEVLIDGYKPNTVEAKSKIGFLSQQNSLRKNCYVNEELDLVIDLFGVKNTNPIEYLTKYGLDKYYKYKTKKLSGGLKRRVLISMTLLPEQEIVILDEPVSGLDTFSRDEIWNMITEYSKNNIVLVADHYLNQAAQYADYVYLLDKGKIIAEGDVSSLMSTVPKSHVIKVRKGKHSSVEKRLDEQGLNYECRTSGTVYNYYIDDTELGDRDIVNIVDSEFNINNINFEDLYFYYTGKYSYEGGDSDVS